MPYLGLRGNDLFMDKDKGIVKRANELRQIIEKGGDVGLKGDMNDEKKKAIQIEMTAKVRILNHKRCFR